MYIYHIYPDIRQ